MYIFEALYLETVNGDGEPVLRVFRTEEFRLDGSICSSEKDAWLWAISVAMKRSEEIGKQLQTINLIAS